MCIWYWVYRCRLARKRLNFQICSSSLEWRCPGPTLACQDVGKLQCSEKLSTRRRLFKKRTYCGHDAVLGRWVMLTDRCYTLTCARWFRWLAAPTVGPSPCRPHLTDCSWWPTLIIWRCVHGHVGKPCTLQPQSAHRHRVLQLLFLSFYNI